MTILRRKFRQSHTAAPHGPKQTTEPETETPQWKDGKVLNPATGNYVSESYARGRGII